MKFTRSAVYFAITGIVGFFVGRIIPRNWLRPGKGLFRCFSFEKEGRIYEKLNIRSWQNKVPDMSKILPSLIPAKKLEQDYALRLSDMICETCIAEFIHLLLCFSGLYCLKLWPGTAGIIVTIIYILFLNLPFILIQRYNRPRLMRLQQRCTAQAEKKKENLCARLS